MIGPQILYLEQEGVGIIDSILTGEDNRFSLPKSEFPLFSLSVKKHPEVSKSFLAEPGSPVIHVHID